MPMWLLQVNRHISFDYPLKVDYFVILILPYSQSLLTLFLRWTLSINFSYKLFQIFFHIRPKGYAPPPSFLPSRIFLYKGFCVEYLIARTRLFNHIYSSIFVFCVILNILKRSVCFVLHTL